MSTTTITTTEIRTLIMRGLSDRAALCRREAKQRRIAGTQNKNARAALREEAQRCDDIARIVSHTDLLRLAGWLASSAHSTTKEGA